jgi:hypothetical protein
MRSYRANIVPCSSIGSCMRCTRMLRHAAGALNRHIVSPAFPERGAPLNGLDVPLTGRDTCLRSKLVPGDIHKEVCNAHQASLPGNYTCASA